MKKANRLLAMLLALLLFGMSTATTLAQTDLTQVTNTATGSLLQAGSLPQTPEVLPTGGSTIRKTRAVTDTAESYVLRALENMESAITVSQFNIYESDLKAFYFGLINQNPQLFFVDNRVGYSSTLSGQVTIIRPQYTETKEDAAIMSAQLEAEVAAALAAIPQGVSDAEKILAANDYIAYTAEYDQTYSKYNAYNIFVEKTAVCQGYSLAFLLLMNRLGIPCTYVTSDAMNHGWNLVQLDGEWYHVDVTWNDPTYDMLGQVYHTYLLRSDNAMLQELEHHSWSATAPQATSTTYESMFWLPVKTAMWHNNGNWYYMQPNTSTTHKILYTNYASGNTQQLLSFSAVWKSSGGSNWIRAPYLSAYDGLLYYFTQDALYRIGFDGSGNTKFYTDPTLQVTNTSLERIYEMNIQGDYLHYRIRTSPNGSAYLAEKTIKLKPEVTFDTQGGNAIASGRALYGDVFQRPANPTKAGYTFMGWQLDGVEYPFTQPATQDITLTAVWQRDSAVNHTVTFQTNGGSAIAAATVPSGAAVTRPADPTRSGYTFVGWQLGGVDYDFTLPVTQNITLTAVWQKVTALEGISLSSTSLAVCIDDTQQLTVQFAPATATNKAVTWTSDNPGIAAVTQDGLVTAKAFGSTVIRATAADGGHVATCTVNTGFTVHFNAGDGVPNPASVQVFYPNKTLSDLPMELVNDGYTLKGWFTAPGGKGTAIHTNLNLTTFTNTGALTLYAYWAIPVADVFIVSSPATLEVGQTGKIQAYFTPANATNAKMDYYSFNESIATVDQNGVITAKAAGEVTIAVGAIHVFGSTHKHVSVTVTQPTTGTTPVTGIQLNKTGVTLAVGETETLLATVTPADATNRNVSWTSSSPQVAAVDADGKVTANAAGSTVITAKTDDGGLTATCKVTVQAPADIQVEVVRLSGENRYETANALAGHGWTNSPYAVIATGKDYADGLAGVPLAKALDAPLFLVKANKLEASLHAQMQALGVKTVYLLGQEDVVSKQFARNLEKKGYSILRLGGDTRFDTAIEIAKELQRITGKTPNTVYLANSHNYAYTAAGSVAAALDGSPILYVRSHGTLDAATANYLQALGVRNVTVLGGEDVIESALEENLAAIGINNSTRIAGENGYAMSVQVANSSTALLRGTDLAVATGANFPDSITGATLCAKLEIPLLLLDENAGITIADYAGAEQADILYVYGGTAALPDAAVDAFIAG